MDRIVRLVNYILARLGESSTWQGIGFAAGLAGARWINGMDWGAAAAFGGMISGMIKVMLPDRWRSAS